MGCSDRRGKQNEKRRRDIFNKGKIMDQSTIQFDKNGFALSYGLVKVYCASTVTREYLGTKMERTSIGLSLSAGAYLDEPTLPSLPNKTICRSVDEQAWEYLPDYRGKTVYHTQTGESVKIVELGDIPEEFTQQAPETDFDKWNGKQWVTDVKAQRQYEVQQTESQKRYRLSQATNAIAPLQYAVDLQMETKEEQASLLAWKKYCVLLNRVDCSTAPNIDWPKAPE
jgi:hypothetical protein